MKKRLKKWLIIFGVGFTLKIMLAILLFYYFSDLLAKPNMESLLNYRPPATTIVYDENWEEIGGFAKENRIVIPLSEMGETVQKVFIAAEDKRFFAEEPEGNFCGLARSVVEKFHVSVDPCSLYRSVLRNIKEHRPAEGASTIPQQLAQIAVIQENDVEQNLVRQSLWRKKIRKAVIAYYIEKNLSKEQILELWLNHMYLGNGNFGVEAASLWYFQKSAKELTIPETAMLAGLIRSPSRSPFNEGMKEKAEKLRTRVLKQLLDEKIISNAEFSAFIKHPLPPAPPQENHRFPNSHILEYVRQQLKLRYDENEVWMGGLKIQLTINKYLQEFAETAVGEAIAEYHKRHPVSEEKTEKITGALVIMQVATGEIKAWVNSEDFEQDKFDRVYQAKRQPGSAFKAIVYTAAVKNGAKLDCNDEGEGKCKTQDVRTICLNMGKDKPKKCIQNYPYKNIPRYRGETELKIALWESRNAATVCLVTRCKLLNIKEVNELAKKMGISTALYDYPTTAIGASEVTLMDLTKAINIIANFGGKIEPYMIETIFDRNDKEIERYKPQEDEKILDESTALQMVRGLRGVVEYRHGTAYRANWKRLNPEFKCPAAGKTGTATNEKGQATDNWFIGFTPSYIFGGWMGFDKKLPLGEEETGGKNILPLFIKIMNEIYKDGSCEIFPENTDPFKPFSMKNKGPESTSQQESENEQFNESD
ncbi:MAG: hypothetical protein A3G49_02340 [Candidatus Sungbacteria bacterium RIFCSPLOWO2_12_FULL_41_11]|uniref:peptidoglycan glycosyltransferase n=1 Tax=Candidatus Sungbacteria bacterium RIFCSPLOWO2_12_FULL_41_11 TaxID=1802286 RepID=A0A1G2LNJ1_9BACT|nr:MAG: hypothetical protein UV01_C0004G0058 [Parcubacteria group bacterium GW2011_GWA2_42_14]OGZ99264.1 MAG: hypothetical protein A3D41_02995 [Candidatus Sungbacteria bacterium RIFCSPHIGHO2_02_FULL_41_12b]OHA13180.1 MAG: hypothetical protein A3G49_02340 [Candidatus Sungbacteria bacterium RIFCSPLOWO2_12_FULL_41_11]